MFYDIVPQNQTPIEEKRQGIIINKPTVKPIIKAFIKEETEEEKIRKETERLWKTLTHQGLQPKDLMKLQRYFEITGETDMTKVVMVNNAVINLKNRERKERMKKAATVAMTLLK